MMAFKREHIESTYFETGQTSSPLDSNNVQDLIESKTLDSKQISESYEKDPQTNEKQLDTGAFIPKDLIVKLVRADSANWEIFLSSFYSITLTFFGIYLGSWLSISEQGNSSFTVLEKSATFFFLFISIILIVIWIIVKVRQKKRGVKITLLCEKSGSNVRRFLGKEITFYPAVEVWRPKKRAVCRGKILPTSWCRGRWFPRWLE